jgi:carboxyl-terminal processing protease
MMSMSAVARNDIAPRLALVERAIATAEAAVADPRWVSGPAWEAFKKRVREPEMLMLDDESFLLAFNQAAADLPFSHFRLHQSPAAERDLAEPPAVVLDWPREDVAVLRVRAFAGDPAMFAQAVSEVIEGPARALILDLRGTPGGSFPTTVALSRGLRQEAVDVGAFLTRGWFARHGDYPDEQAYVAIPPLPVVDLATFKEQLQRDGAARLVLPSHDSPVHRGDLMILTDHGTASTAESFTYLLQKNGATVIGEPTAGAMLSAEFFPLDENFRLFVPVADYIAPDLVRLDGHGVQPNIEVPSEQALDRALAEIERFEGLR